MAQADHRAAGIGVIDLQQRQRVRTIPSGSDPEQFAVTPDRQRLYISNEENAAGNMKA